MLGGSVSGPAFLANDLMTECRSYRDAVCLAWRQRRSKGMTQRGLSELCEWYPQHVSDYLSPDDVNPKGQRRRCLPAERIATFEAVVGNRAVTQFLIRQASLHLMEEMISQQAQAVA
ncbi:hypothetical protein LMG28138_01827 [Pararobbsia alpina]|uniref:Uncharacterized protein n=2 Tax=Pararobbsia alpina TaxID=621374 RepID=A0A6S7B199_9BURK|nr:hypothetical protein LMG28138_01827 [Pararobbsia alpina]